MLYCADFDHVEQYDESITGARYRKLDHGPVPDAAAIALDALEREGQVEHRSIRSGPYGQDRYDPLADVDVSVFSAAEIDTLHRVVRRWAAHTTKQIEAATHGEAPWIAVRWNEVIPYHLAYYRNSYGAMELDEAELVVPEELREQDEAVAR